MKRYLAICILPGLLLAAVSLQAQVKKADAVMLTGMVLDADTRAPMPYVGIQVKNTVYGTASDTNGYFSLFISPGDTLLFSSIGYSDATFVMPVQTTQKSYSLIQLMRQSTVMLSEVVVFPWPTVDNFKRAFLDVEPDRNMDDLVREVQVKMENEVRVNQLNQYEADQRRYQRLYELNHIFPPNNFLNPMRWNQFIREVTSGEQEDEEE